MISTACMHHLGTAKGWRLLSSGVSNLSRSHSLDGSCEAGTILNSGESCIEASGPGGL